MRVDVDPDILAAAAALQSTVPAAKLVAVAEGVAKLAPALWGQLASAEKVQVIRLVSDPISDHAQHIRLTANE